MKDEIKDLIYSIANGNASDSEDLLNSIMAQKAVSGLDAFRIEVAKSMFSETEGVAEGAPIVVMPSPERLKKLDPIKVRYQGDIIPPTQPPSTEKRGVKGRPGQRPMPKYEGHNAAKDSSK